MGFGRERGQWVLQIEQSPPGVFSSADVGKKRGGKLKKYRTVWKIFLVYYYVCKISNVCPKGNKKISQ